MKELKKQINLVYTYCFEFYFIIIEYFFTRSANLGITFMFVLKRE